MVDEFDCLCPSVTVIVKDDVAEVIGVITTTYCTETVDWPADVIAG